MFFDVISFFGNNPSNFKGFDFLRYTLLFGGIELIHRYKAPLHQVKSPSQLLERSKHNFRKPRYSNTTFDF